MQSLVLKLIDFSWPFQTKNDESEGLTSNHVCIV